MEELKGYCLFCLEKITPYSVSTSFEVDNGGNWGNNNFPGFLHLCTLLNVKLSDEMFTKLEVLPVFLTPPEEGDNGGGSGVSCEGFLCLKCFEAVVKLDKLYKELESIQKKIEDSTKLIKGLISEKIDGVSMKSYGGRRKRGRRKKHYVTVEFVEAFQKLVRDSAGINFNSRSTSETENLTVLKRALTTLQPVWSIGSRNRQSNGSRSPKRRRSSPTKAHGSGQLLKNTHLYQGAHVEPVDVKTEIFHGDELLNDSDCLLNDDLDDWSDGNYEVTAEKDIKLFSSISKLPTVPTEDTDEEKGQEKVDSAPPTKDATTQMKKLRKRGATKTSVIVPKKPQTTIPKEFTCRYCDAKFTKQANYTAHRKTHLPPTMESLGVTTVYDSSEKHKRIAYRICPICSRKQNGPVLSRFMEHTLSHEMNPDNPSSPPLSCDKCEKKFFLQLNLDLHKICQHVSNHPLKCEYCESSNSKTQEELIAHLKSHNADIRIHACKSCPMACTTLDKLLKHMLKHQWSKRLFCSECDDFVTSSFKELYLHINKVHPELKKTFDCHLCEKTFIMPSSLSHHLRQSHGFGSEDTPRDLRCPKCSNGHIYKSKASLDLHLAHYHTDADKLPFKCEQCNKAFLYKSYLQNHIDEKHNQTKHPCPHCSKTYLDKSQLIYHIRTHTGEGLFTCEKCGKQFPTKKRLKVHSVVHLEKNEENCCVCEICGKEFSNPFHLGKHMNIHKEKRLECEYCHMKFRRPDHLRSHLRTHTGERPFICPICSKGFNRKDIMIVHMKVHGFGQEEAGRVYKRHLEDNQNMMKNEETNDDKTG